MAPSPRLERITPDSVEAACDLSVRPDQEQFVKPVVRSPAEMYASPGVASPRPIVDGDELVGFVMGFFGVRITWAPGSRRPERFYTKPGFRPTGELSGDQGVGEVDPRDLRAAHVLRAGSVR